MAIHQKRSDSEREKDNEKELSHPRGKDEARDQKSRDKRENTRTQAKNNRAAKGETNLEPGKSTITTDHRAIRQWIEERGGKPAAVKATEGKNDPGLLRVDFPGRGGEDRLEEISWENFFDQFEEKKLAFLYQEQTLTGRVSRFSKFVSRSRDEK